MRFWLLKSICEKKVYTQWEIFGAVHSPFRCQAPKYHCPGRCHSFVLAWHLHREGTKLWHRDTTSHWHLLGTKPPQHIWHCNGTKDPQCWHCNGTGTPPPPWHLTGTKLPPTWHLPGTCSAPSGHLAGTKNIFSYMEPFWHLPGTNFVLPYESLESSLQLQLKIFLDRWSVFGHSTAYRLD